MAEERTLLQAFVDEVLKGRTALRVLDAGCGSSSYVRMPENAFRVGIDISEEQLQKNTFVDEKILGDIQTCELPPSSFDVIVCWWVLEHIRMPEKVLSNFCTWLKEDGMIVVAVPNVLSLKGLVTKSTPHWFHVWVYRSLYGYGMAGAPGFPPFRAWLRFSISPVAIRHFARKSGLSIAYLSLFEDDGTKSFRQQHAVVNVCLSLLRGVVRLLTLGKVDIGLTEFIVVLKKAEVARGTHTLAQPADHVA